VNGSMGERVNGREAAFIFHPSLINFQLSLGISDYWLLVIAYPGSLDSSWIMRGFGTWDLGAGNWYPEPRSQSPGPRTQVPEPKSQVRFPMSDLGYGRKKISRGSEEPREYPAFNSQPIAAGPVGPAGCISVRSRCRGCPRCCGRTGATGRRIPAAGRTPPPGCAGRRTPRTGSTACPAGS